MSPKQISEEQKEKTRQRLLAKGAKLVLQHGFKKVSIDDILSAVGIPKGTFYFYFDSKESYMFSIFKYIHEYIIIKTDEMFLNNNKNRQGFIDSLKLFMKNLLKMPEFIFIMKNHSELENMFSVSFSDEIATFKKNELDAYARWIQNFGADISKVKAEVIMNCFYTIVIGLHGSGFINAKYLAETADVLVDGIMHYIMQY